MSEYFHVDKPFLDQLATLGWTIVAAHHRAARDLRRSDWSGKSLTMVFVARMLRASNDLADFKILMVNDRIDLEEQLAGTARLIGGKVNVIESTAGLREHLRTDASDVNVVMVHKFLEREEAVPLMVAEALASYGKPPTAETFGMVNKSERILLMIDEAHRTQSSDLGDNLFEAFPNATRIAFTGTPLITEQHGTKRTVKRFGEYIDTYKLMDSVRDGATPCRSSTKGARRMPPSRTSTALLFRQRSQEEILAIKKKYGATGDILEAEKRIAAIARDMIDHYVDNILPDGFKGLDV
jgi:type I restriction enzyme R subunit